MKQYNNGTVIQPAQFDDLRVAANATQVNPATSKPDYGTFRGNLRTFLFDGTSNEGVTFAVQLPHGYKLGTDITPHVHWSPMAAPTDTQTVIWYLEYSLAEINGNFAAASTVGPGTHTFSGDSQYDHLLTGLGTIDMSAITSVSSMLQCYLYRDAANDTSAMEVALHELDFHYQMDQPGSRQLFIK